MQKPSEQLVEDILAKERRILELMEEARRALDGRASLEQAPPPAVKV